MIGRQYLSIPGTDTKPKAMNVHYRIAVRIENYRPQIVSLALEQGAYKTPEQLERAKERKERQENK